MSRPIGITAEEKKEWEQMVLHRVVYKLHYPDSRSQLNRRNAANWTDAEHVLIVEMAGLVKSRTITLFAAVGLIRQNLPLRSHDAVERKMRVYLKHGKLINENK